jgi:hypothetical protein
VIKSTLDYTAAFATCTDCEKKYRTIDAISKEIDISLEDWVNLKEDRDKIVEIADRNKPCGCYGLFS